jgi:hypothetical protein
MAVGFILEPAERSTFVLMATSRSPSSRGAQLIAHHGNVYCEYREGVWMVPPLPIPSWRPPDEGHHSRKGYNPRWTD